MDTVFVLVGQGGITVGAAFYDAVLRRCGRFDEHASADGYLRAYMQMAPFPLIIPRLLRFVQHF